MGADRRGGLFTACADPGDNVVRVFADGVSCGFRGVGESISDGFAMIADRRDRLLAALAHAGDDVVSVFDYSVSRR